MVLYFKRTILVLIISCFSLATCAQGWRRTLFGALRSKRQS